MPLGKTVSTASSTSLQARRERHYIAGQGLHGGGEREAETMILGVGLLLEDFEAGLDLLGDDAGGEEAGPG